MDSFLNVDARECASVQLDDSVGEVARACIGAHPFFSPRTVEWHLGKGFGTLAVSSRRQLRDPARTVAESISW
jgi:hypothetical protein